jgi:nucleotide-binding universal stress UspA family protein
MPIQHILVPTDFSPYAEQALSYAIEMAQTLKARLTLLHVIQELPLGAGEGLTAFPPAYLQALEANAQQGLQQALQRVHAAGLTGDSALIFGAPFNAIIETARDQQVDLIIMGTQGRTGLAHLLVGSVAEKVVRLAPCPVLVTRSQSESPTG